MRSHLFEEQNYFLTWLITSSTKLSSRFSIPSPTSKRTNDFTVAPFEATNFSTVMSGSLTNGWSTKAISALNFFKRP